MVDKIILLVLISSIVCVHSGLVFKDEGTRVTEQSLDSFGCDNCYPSEFKVCLDGNCLCQPNYIINNHLNGSWSCQYEQCTTDSSCGAHTKRHCSNGTCFCDQGYFEDLDNGGKCTLPLDYTNNCSNCLSSDNKVCLDDWCYCSPNYRKQFTSLTSWTCVYEQCLTTSECQFYQDETRVCSNGSCICRLGYFEDLENGRKCTKPSEGEYDCSDCLPSDNRVCVDDSCYCQPNYIMQFDSQQSWTCVYEGCTISEDWRIESVGCKQAQDSDRYCSNGTCVCYPGYFENLTNGQKCTKPSGRTDCSACNSLDHKVCVDDSCYCQPNYKKQYYSLHSWNCSFEKCSTNSDCKANQDENRHCSSGSCVCDVGYFEDPANGRKCTQPYIDQTCANCFLSDHKVCMDYSCYCQPDYKFNYTSLHTWNCTYGGCSSDSQCDTNQNRHCSDGTCVCDLGYFEDWTNGRKCTKPSSYKSTDCSDCVTSEHKICVNDQCYCQSNYKKQFTSLTSWSCTYELCSSDSECEGDYSDYYRQCSDGKCVCESGYVEDWTNGGKCTRPSTWQTNDCTTNCFYSDHKVCIDSDCYCQSNYKQQYKSPKSWDCAYQGCSTDSECQVAHDSDRHCSEGSCVCNLNYHEDWNNGGKCTYGNLSSISPWAWAWVFILIPIAIIVAMIWKKYGQAGNPPPYTPTDSQ